MTHVSLRSHLVALVLSASVIGARAQSVQKLPLAVNTPDQSELLPVISSDGRTLYFTRTRMGIEQDAVFDIWMSHITGDSTFSPAEFVGGNLSSSYGVAVTSVAPDNNTLYIIGRLKNDSPPEERLFVTHRVAGGWSIPETIHIPGLHSQGVYTDYSFGPDQKTLVMAVMSDSTLGDRDLYVSFLDATTHAWSVPLWLGPEINSAAAEMTPYLASDNKTLYFSSGRIGGFGSIDVYRSVRLDDTWKHWSPPENLGTSVNRPGRTTFYTEDAEGKYAYFSWRPSVSEQSDIYRTLVRHARAVALIKGIVTDALGKPLLARVHYARLSDGTELGSARSDPATGAFQLSLPGGEDYSLRAEKEGYFPTSEQIDLRELKAFTAIERNLKITKIEVNTPIALKNVFFELDKSTLLAASYPELARVKSLLADHAEYTMEIAGHTDSTGSEAHNRELAKARAEAVRAYLVSQGVAAARLEAAGYGSSKPVATNATEDGRAMNRRVEFILRSKENKP